MERMVFFRSFTVLNVVWFCNHSMICWLGYNYGNCLNICDHNHVLWNDYNICRILVRLLYFAWNNHLFVQIFFLFFYSFLCWFHYPPLMLVSFCLLDSICCEAHCVLLENRWHSFPVCICLFVFHGSHFDRWLLWSDARRNFWSLYWIPFIIDFLFFLGVLVEWVFYDFSEMFSAPQVLNCIPVTRSMVWNCYTVLVVCELTEIWGWQEPQNHINPPMAILELARGKFLQSRGIVIIMLLRNLVG